MEMNSETNFKLELIVNNYSKIFDIEKKLLQVKGQEYYFKYYNDELQDETLALCYSIKEIGKFCTNYKKEVYSKE